MYKALSIHKIRQNTKMPTFYKTLYLVGMQSVLIVMLSGTTNPQIVEEIALVVAFAVLAAFTYTSGLRAL
jgi:hypothetical protein